MTSFALALLTCYLTLFYDSPIKGPKGWDKIYHFLAFFGVVLPSALFDRRDMLWIAFGALVLGAGIEAVQPYVGRKQEWADFVADAAGVGAAVLLGFVFRSIKRRVLRR